MHTLVNFEQHWLHFPFMIIQTSAIFSPQFIVFLWIDHPNISHIISSVYRFFFRINNFCQQTGFSTSSLFCSIPLPCFPSKSRLDSIGSHCCCFWYSSFQVPTHDIPLQPMRILSSNNFMGTTTPKNILNKAYQNEMTPVPFSLGASFVKMKF